MPNLKLLDQIKNKLVSAGAENDEELKKILERVDPLSEASQKLYTKVKTVKEKYTLAGYKDYEKRAKEDIPKEDSFSFFTDFMPLGVKNQGLCTALENYVAGHENDEDKEKVDAVKKALELANLKYKRDMAFQNDFMLGSGQNSDNLFDEIYSDKVPEAVKENEAEKENLNDNGSEIDDSQDEIDKRLLDPENKGKLYNNDAIDLGHIENENNDLFDVDNSRLDQSVVNRPGKEVALDDALRAAKKNDQLTGSSEYTYAYDTLLSLRKIDKILDDEIKHNTDNELYISQKEAVLSHKKDILCVIDHYLNRKTDEKNAAEAKGKRENKNSARRRKTMENLKKALEKDIKKTQTELGVSDDTDKEFYAGIRRELEYGDYITMGGSESYHNVLEGMRGIEQNADKPKNISKQLNEEIDLLGKMKTYIDQRYESEKKDGKYEFSLNGGKDGRRLEGKNNTQVRYQIMLKSMEKLGNRITEKLKTFYPRNEVTKNVLNQCASCNLKYGINIKTNAIPKEPSSYEELISLEEKKLSVAKEEALKKEVKIKKTSVEKQTREIEKRKRYFEDYKQKNPNAKDISKGYNAVFEKHNTVTNTERLDYAGYEFLNSGRNMEIYNYKLQAVDLLYANVASKSGEEFDLKAHEKGREKFSEDFRNTKVGMEFCEKMGAIFDLSKNKAKTVNKTQVDSKTLDSVLKASVEDVFNDICKDAEADVNKNSPSKDTLQAKLDNAKKVIEQAKELHVNDTAETMTQKYNELVEKAKPVMEGRKQNQKNNAQL